MGKRQQRFVTGKQALQAERRKWDGPNGWQVKVNPVAVPGTKYGNYLQQHHNIVFVPMAFESMGATGRTFTTFLRLVSEQVHKDSKRAQAEFRAEWRKKIGMALHNTVVAKHYLTVFRFRRIRQNKQDLAIWNKDKAYTQFNKGRREAAAIQTNFT